MTAVRAPASSANLGAGFDVLAMALGVALEIGDGQPPERARVIDEHHPTRRAFEGAGGDQRTLWIRGPVPMGRGMGFSGAARVGGAALAVALDRGGLDDVGRAAALDVAADLEGHGDNAAASVFGGIVAWTNGRALALPLGPRLGDAALVLWIPRSSTSTDRSRASLAPVVDRAAATANLATLTQLIVALSRDDPALLVGATADELHQPTRLADRPDSAAALQAGIEAGAWCGWLSGSGPTIALWADSDVADAVVTALPTGGTARQVAIDRRGVELVE
ncbi:MAG: hypothetical protein AAGA42_10825 [Actinomycetota bacterium]